MFLLTLALTLAIQDPGKAQPPRNPAQLQQPQGKIQTLPKEKLQKFDKPVLQPKHPKPHVDHPGHVWRWHPHHHHWVALPVAVAPQAVVLDAGYALPTKVVVWQAPTATVIICPHCASSITISVH